LKILPQTSTGTRLSTGSIAVVEIMLEMDIEERAKRQIGRKDEQKRIDRDI